MKKHLSKKALWQSLLSVLALGIFILLSTGSYEFIFFTDYLGDGVYKTTDYFSKDEREITTGKRDDYGRWHGPVTIELYVGEFTLSETEEVTMVNGKRHGKSKTTWSPLQDSYTYTCYNMGQRVDCEESARKSMAVVSSFQVLSNKYPWFLYTLNAFGFEDEYVEAYMDTLETVLATYEFEDIEFDDYYQDVIDVLDNTFYDSIIVLNSTLSIHQGLEELKNAEFRLALIDRYKSDGNSTYNIVKTTYPGYLLSITDMGVTDQDFEGFCQELDSIMAGDETLYGSLDLEDPFFVDSVDARMFRALSSIIETEESSSSTLKSLKSTALVYFKNDFRSSYNEVNSILASYLSDSTSQVVAGVVLFFMLQQFDQGDIIKRSVREAYFSNKGVIFVPTVTTEFSGNNSATSVTLNGYVIEDGGATVTSRGIAWASFYNPTTNDNSESSGTGTGSFAVTLDGLTEGASYYARTYATNSAGTAYGNCIRFTASGAVSINDHEIFIRNFNVYPNPASALTTFSFQVESSESMVLTIVNLKGQVVYHNDLGSMPQGENKIELDLSDFQNGVYNCLLTSNGTIKVTRKLVIAH